MIDANKNCNEGRKNHAGDDARSQLADQCDLGNQRGLPTNTDSSDDEIGSFDVNQGYPKSHKEVNAERK